MYLKIITKHFKEQFCYNFCLNEDVFDVIFSYLYDSKTKCLLDIILENNNKYKKKKDFKHFKDINSSFTYSVLPIEYIFLKNILHTFITLFKNDIFRVLNNSCMNINNNNTECFIQNKTISIDIQLYKNIKHNNQFFIFFKINWKTAKFIYNLLYLKSKNTSQYIINHLFLYNNVNELINIQYFTKKKINNKNTNKKNEIFTFLILFINNFFSKLKYKYLLANDINENYYEINEKSKTNIDLCFNLKISQFITTDTEINNKLFISFINDILIQTLYHIY
jgi:hypothetical protein